jgi:putative hydrolase of the HAD superfamily
LTKYKAVIFDLGGTLMVSPPWSQIVAESRRIAAAVGAPEEEFARRWDETLDAASRGAFRNMREYTSAVCRQMGLHPADTQLDAAAALATDGLRRCIRSPRDGAMEVFDYLRSHGIKTGLITSCGPDVPETWDEAPYASLIDVAIFSCVEGVDKNDPRIFWLAAHRLKVQPEECLYIADGYRGELASAATLGMHAVQLNVPGEGERGRPHDPWDGQVISSLLEILGLIG